MDVDAGVISARPERYVDFASAVVEAVQVAFKPEPGLDDFGEVRALVYQAID